MKLTFSIHYLTEWGQSVHIDIAYHYTNGRKRSYDLIMQTLDGEFWTLETSVMESRNRDIDYFEYTYLIEDQDGKALRREWDRVPRRYYFDSTKNYIMPDCWRDIPLQYHLMSRLCRTCDDRTPSEGLSDVRMPLYRKTVVFHVLAPQLEKGQSLGICGNHPTLGNWSPSMFLKMHRKGEDDWMLSVNVQNGTTTVTATHSGGDNITASVLSVNDLSSQSPGLAFHGRQPLPLRYLFPKDKRAVRCLQPMEIPDGADDRRPYQ